MTSVGNAAKHAKSTGSDLERHAFSHSVSAEHSYFPSNGTNILKSSACEEIRHFL
ncbi:hypothetical protein IWQ54_002432 [Labrenzia sp. EL_195]|nr:hypothetical protein [Labrenzia sp. EL_195]